MELTWPGRHIGLITYHVISNMVTVMGLTPGRSSFLHKKHPNRKGVRLYQSDKNH